MEIKKDKNPNIEVQTSEKSNPLSHQRRVLSKNTKIIGAGILAYATGMSLGLVTDIKPSIPDVGNFINSLNPLENKGTEANPFGIGEGQARNGILLLANNEESFRDQMLGFMNYTPDGPITYWTTKEGSKRYLLTGGDGNGTYMLETDGKQTLKEIMGSGKIDQNSFVKVYGPDLNVEYRNGYAGITSVLQTDKNNPDHLWGIAHCEQRTSRNASADYTATIGLTESLDGGKTWVDKGPLIIGKDAKAPGAGRASGAGQPTAIFNPKDGYAYIMYIDWSASNTHPDQLYMARLKANGDGSLGTVEYYTSDGFTTDFSKNLTPVIPVPEESNMVYVALPHISWNTQLNQFIAQGESDIGFWSANSSDLLHWSKPQIIYDFSQRGGKPHSVLSVGEKWDSYPSLLSEAEPNSQITDSSGILYHSTGDNITPHEPATVDLTIQS